MVADIFYPILTLKITVLVSFIQKKKIGGLAPNRASLWTPWWAYSSPPLNPLSCKKKNVLIFFLDYPLDSQVKKK